MTALCGGGTSGAKPGQEAALIYSSGRLVQVLEGLALDWLAPLIPLVPIAPFVLATFCATDPPAVVDLTQAEANALLQTDITSADFGTGLAKLPAIFENAIWNYSCQCTSGTYTPPTVTQPGGTTIVVQPLPSSTTPCNTSCTANNDVGLQPCQWRLITGITNMPMMGLNAAAGTSPTAASIDITKISGSGSTPAMTLIFRYVAAGLTEIDHSFPFAAGWTSIHQVDAFPPGGYVGMDLNYTTTGTATAQVIEVHESLWCNGNLPGVQEPCCPPDAATQGYLDNILKMVTLIQRQQVPFGYVAGTSHSALTGTGELSIQGLLGAKILPTTIPSDAGIEAGDPDTYWLDSWINWGNADGWTTREFLRASPHISLPAYAGQFTKLGYSLRPGLTVTIVELEREA